MLLLALTLMTGCAADARDGGRSADPDAAIGNSETGQLWADMRQAANLPKVALKAPATVKPRGRFTRADVKVLTDRALDVIDRSANPRLSGMDPSSAINYVYVGQYPASTNDFRTNAANYTAGWDWQWLAASRFPTTPSQPRVIKLTGASGLGKGKIYTGETAPYLTVTIQAHILQTVTTRDHRDVPIVVRRTVKVGSYKPRGGPDWWPSVIARTSLFGNQPCSLYKGALLRPLNDPDELRKDLAQLKISLDFGTVVPENFGGPNDPQELKKAINQECDTKNPNS